MFCVFKFYIKSQEGQMAFLTNGDFMFAPSLRMTVFMSDYRLSPPCL